MCACQCDSRRYVRSMALKKEPFVSPLFVCLVSNDRDSNIKESVHGLVVADLRLLDVSR